MSTKGELVRNEITRLQGLRDNLDIEWSRVRWVGVLLPFTGVVYALSDALMALFYFLSVGGFLATGAYLISVRRREYDGEIAELHINLKQLAERA